jgi:hypothetical protein
LVAHANAVDFTRDAWPILEAHCVQCHGAKKQKSSLRVDSRAALLKGGDAGPAIIPGDPDKSYLIELVSSRDADERMPYEADPLTATQIATLRQWIAEGAPCRSGFLPAAFQGTSFSVDQPPRNLRAPAGVGADNDVAARDLLARLNDEHLARFPGDSQLAARIASYELAGRMQVSIPALLETANEPAHVLAAYGTDSANVTKAAYARNCILARRLLEKCVRVVQLFNGGSNDGGMTNWDSHDGLLAKHGKHAEIFDQPTAALLSDLRQRGMLDRTLVVWCSEFGRMPFMQANGTGRDHNIEGFTCWLMGAGVKAPFSFGATDAFGRKAVQDKATLYDFNATILHLLGLDHERLTYYHNGTDRRVTDVHGHVLKGILA